MRDKVRRPSNSEPLICEGCKECLAYLIPKTRNARDIQQTFRTLCSCGVESGPFFHSKDVTLDFSEKTPKNIDTKLTDYGYLHIIDYR
jgi:hypothetical protein